MIRALLTTEKLRDPGNDSDSSSDDVRENIIKASWDQTFEKYDDLLFGSRNNTVDLSTLHPDAVHIFRLWQIYLDNANPLLKVTHTPSLQGRIIEAASNVPNINPNLEALMFSIYCMAVLSLVEEGCEAMFGSSKDDLLFRYQFACRQALMNAGVLRTGERDCLTALYLYSVSPTKCRTHGCSRSQVSVVPRTDPRSLSSMLGIAVRIAQRMGLHSESANVKCTVLEAEMRRRLWWSLVLFDTRICELADSKTSTLAPTWDCKIPLNVNDSDLRPEMKEPPVIQGQSTDALFAVVRSELGDFVRHTLFHLEFTSPALKAIAKDVPEGGETVALEKMIEDRYLKFCNPENPLHFMTLWMARAYLAKCRFMEYFSTFSNPAVAPSETQRDTANSLALSILECDTKMMASPLIKGYLWLLNFYFPFPGYIQVLRDLRRRPIAKHAEHAWEVMSDNYSARLIPLGREAGPFHGILAGMVLEAWEARDAAYREQAEPAMPPRIVSYIRHRLAQAHNNGAAENTDGVTGLDMNDPSSSTPMDFGSPSLLYSMVGQDGYSGMASMGYPTMPAQAATDVDVNQFAWSATDWGLLNLSAGDRTHQAESTWPSPPGQAPASQGP